MKNMEINQNPNEFLEIIIDDKDSVDLEEGINSKFIPKRYIDNNLLK